VLASSASWAFEVLSVEGKVLFNETDDKVIAVIVVFMKLDLPGSSFPHSEYLFICL